MRALNIPGSLRHLLAQVGLRIFFQDKIPRRVISLRISLTVFVAALTVLGAFKISLTSFKS